MKQQYMIVRPTGDPDPAWAWIWCTVRSEARRARGWAATLEDALDLAAPVAKLIGIPVLIFTRRDSGFQYP